MRHRHPILNAGSHIPARKYPESDRNKKTLTLLWSASQAAFGESARRSSHKRERVGLVSLHPRQGVGVVSRIAEQLVQDAVALHIEADIIFVGHADAAVHLD